jgi:phage/plasmid-like protein (TIGR03299 family)
MSHEITQNRLTRKAEMAYLSTEGTPWHGLGQPLKPGADLETWRAAAGMDWRICRSRVRYGEAPHARIMDDKHVLFRSDTTDPLGIVSDAYEIVQPAQVLEFFRDLTAAAGFTLSTAGTLFGGKQFWALARVGEDAVVVGDDRVGGYLLLASSCDGSMSTTAQFTTIRVVCNNTLSMAVGARAKARVLTTHRSRFDADAVKAQLGVAQGIFAEFMGAARALSRVRVSNTAAAAQTAKLLVDAKLYKTPELAETSTGYNKIINLFRGSAMGGTLAGTEGTAWGWVNAVTEYVDHHASKRTPDARLSAAWFGAGAALKEAAMAQALELV